MPGPTRGAGVEWQQAAREASKLYLDAFGGKSLGVSGLFGDPTEGMTLATDHISWRARTGRYNANGARFTDEIVASSRRSISDAAGAATAFNQVVPHVSLRAETATYTAEVLMDLISDELALGGLPTSRKFSDQQKEWIEDDVAFDQNADLMSSAIGGELAVVNTALIAGATTFLARKDLNTLATSGNIGSRRSGRNRTYVFADPATLQRIGARAYRMTRVAFGGPAAHDTVTFTPATDVAIPAGSLVCEGDLNSHSAGKGFYPMHQIIGDELDSPVVYGTSRVANPSLSAQVLRGAAKRRYSTALVWDTFRQIAANSQQNENERYVQVASFGIAEDVFTAAATLRAGGIIAQGEQPIMDLVQYRPELRQLWGAGAFDMPCGVAPGGKVTTLFTDAVRPGTAYFLPVSELFKYVTKSPGWLAGPLTGGTGDRVDRQLQAVSLWWCSATQVFRNLPAMGRLDHLFDIVVDSAQGGAGR